MMPDREKVIKGLYDIGGFIAERIGIEQARNFLRTIDEAVALLKEQPPKKGKWQPYKHGDDTWHQCSVCGVADRYIDIVKRDGHPDYRMVSKRNFCPNCGADMRGGCDA